MNGTTLSVADRIDILELSARFAWLIDHCDGDGVPDLFVADGRYGTGAVWREGRDAIRDFYVERHASGTRKSRHVFVNHHFEPGEGDRVVCRSMLILFATDGDAADAAAPLGVLDYRDVLERCDGGGWAYVERAVSPAFGHMPRPGGAR